MLRPALIIALGGTGTNIVERLRERFHLRFGTPNPEGVRFLFIDTDVRHNAALKQYPDRSIGLTVGGNKLRDCQTPGSPTPRELRLDEWFDPGLRQQLTTQKFESGVGGVRMYGRLALLGAERLGDLIRLLNNDILALRRGKKDPDPGSLHIFVVSSAGGGTGSGVFLDMGYLTKWVLNGLNIRGNVCEREGVVAVAVPSHVPAPQQARNSAALLTELDFFSEAQNIFEAVYAGTPLPSDIGREAPYDYTFLASPTQSDQVLDNDTVQAMRHLEQRMGDYLFVRLTEPGGVGARMRDMRENWVVKPKDNRGYPTSFLTFGVGLRQFPVGLCESLGYRQAVSNFVEGWLKKAQEGEAYLSSLALDTDPALSQKYDADLRALRALLGLPPMHAQGTTQPRSCAQDEVYRELVQTSQEGLEDALRKRTREGKVDELFQYAGTDQTVGAGQPGYVTGTVRRNAQRLLDPHNTNNLLNRVRAYLCEAAFDSERGPRYALRLVRDLTQAMEQEEGFMGAVLKEAGVAGSGGAPGLSRAQRVRSDTLLLFWREVAAQREREYGSSDAAAYANRRYECCLVEAKQLVYTTLREKTLTNDVQVRLERMAEYVEAWKAEAEKGGSEQEQLLQNLPPGTVYPKELVEKKWQRLTPAVNPRSLDALRETVYRQEEFLRGIPRTREGNLDFAPFKPMEEQVRSGLRSTQAASAESIYGDSVIRLISEANDGKIQSECQQFVNESRPLLNLRLDAVGYGELLNSVPPAFPQPTHQWYLIAHPSIDADSYRAFEESTQDEAQGIAGLVKAATESPVQELKSDDGSVAAALFIRVALPTRVINQYEQEERRSLLFPPNAEDITTPFTQTGISLPLPDETVKEAQTLLLLGEALLAMSNGGATEPKFTWKGEEHVYEYRLDAHRTAVLKLPKRDFTRAAYVLALNENALNSLRRTLNLLTRDTNQRGIIAERIARHVQELGSRMVKGERQGYYDWLDLGNLNFPQAINQFLSGAHTHGISLDARTERALHPWASYSEEDRLWRCKRDNNVLGGDEPSVDGQCPMCGFPVR